MKKYRNGFYLAIAALFALNLAGASWIALIGSDQSPFEMTFAGQCAYPTIAVVYEDPNKPNPKVIEVDLTGDFSKCVGSQVLVTTYKTGHIHSYAVADIVAGKSKIALKFDNYAGDFYQKFPLISAGRLVPDGPQAPPNPSIDAADIQVTFAWNWT